MARRGRRRVEMADQAGGPAWTARSIRMADAVRNSSSKVCIRRIRTACLHFGNGPAGIAVVRFFDGKTRTLLAIADEGSEERWRMWSETLSYDVEGHSIWRVARTTVSCSDESLEPLSTSIRRRVTGFPEGVVREDILEDVRGNRRTQVLSCDRESGAVELVDSVLGVDAPIVRYEKFGFLEWETDSYGATNHYRYDGLGRLSSMTDSDGGETSYRYDNRGLLVSRSTSLG